MTWRDRANCIDKSFFGENEKPAEIFFPPMGSGKASAWRPDRALEICSSCPVRQECLADAKKLPKIFGVWGGYYFKEGSRHRGPDVREMPRMRAG